MAQAQEAAGEAERQTEWRRPPRLRPPSNPATSPARRDEASQQCHNINIRLIINPDIRDAAYGRRLFETLYARASATHDGFAARLRSLMLPLQLCYA